MTTNDDLIQILIKDGYLKTPAVIEAFKAIDRKDFMPEEIKEQAYLNEALPIGNRQTISQPLVVAFMLELLAIKPGEKILEVGTGSGWQTSIMAQIISKHQAASLETINPQGEVMALNTENKPAPIISIERILDLHNFAKINIAKYNFMEKGIIKLFLGDGSMGCAEGAPYDKIIAGASAETLPESWKEQLKIGGRMVAPVGEKIIVLDKVSKDEMEQKEYFGFSFVPLVHGN
ncbi:MAG: protein-L-isoaspartate(D-aspartate) O-methyltransferase [Parcubacteria group bacterium Athens0714_26]|nr:MAG: protein-L-isoaspartate(D-aspartate) O-methyltransferase [Parcubacteria group bacterium Athens1014_26]TSD03258.1 MAG: protein-L-isoaspartate(D-aspartate) O-methyltransferase [Parcubacteria group bacterium Athens0714_26]